MFGIGSKLRRIGTTPHKVQMSIDVKIVTANDGALMASSCSSVFVEFVRGSNSVTSTRREWPDTGAATLQFEETLTLVMTLYQNKDGTYQDKKGKLVLKGVSKQTQSTDTLGSAELKLHVLAANFETQRVQLELLDKGRRPMGKVNVTTTAKFLGEGKDDDDSSVASSVHSAQQHQGGFPDFGMHHRPLQPTAVGASSTAHSHPELIARYNNYDRPNVPAAASSGFNNSLPAVRTVANDNDSALSSLRAKRGLPAAPAPAPAHYPTPAPMPTTVAATAPGPVAAKAAASAAPAAPAASAAAPARSAPRAGEDDRDREIQRLRQQLEATNERQNTLEGEFQSKITAMIERIIEMEDRLEAETLRHEESVLKLLRAAGVYELSGYDPGDRETTDKLHDEAFLAELFRLHLDDERNKVMTLKSVLIQFADRLSRDDNQRLLLAGVILVPEQS